MSLTLLASLICLAAWILVVFVRPVGLGVVHVLLTASAVLWIRWWGTRNTVNGQQSPVNSTTRAGRS